MRKMYFVTGLAVLAVSASMFTGCGSQTTTSAPAARQTTESTASAAPTATQAPAATESVAQSQPTQSTAAKVAENTTANTAAQITVDEAKNAALANAGLQESDVVYKKAQLETDDGVLKYEIDFYAGDNEYNFDIDAATGAVLKAETEIGILPLMLRTRPRLSMLEPTGSSLKVRMVRLRAVRRMNSPLRVLP